MSYNVSSDGRARRAHPQLRPFALFLSLVGATVLAATPGAAEASARPDLSAAGMCHEVSAASVGAIVGFSVPAAKASADNLKATKENDEISAAVTSCVYGSETSVAALAKTVGLVYEVTSRALTTAELKKGISQAPDLNMTFVPYSGLGLPAIYYTFSESGVFTQGITGLNGKKEYGAFVYTKAVSKSELAALVRLAEKL